MQAITSYPPLEAARRASQKTYPRRPEMPERPLSQSSDSTEIFETDFEDDEDDDSDFETRSHKRSFESYDSRRRSQTTISSYNEAPTPDTAANDENQFEIRFRPVQGPSGPHLFRFSSASAEFDFKNALQMSPIVSSKAETFDFADTASLAAKTVTPVTATFLGGMSFEDAFEQAATDLLEDSQADIRAWSAQDVIDWMYDTGIDPGTITSFSRHDVNGTVLLDLDFDDLKELDILSFGKRHQLWSAICALRGDEVRARSPSDIQDISRPSTRTGKRSPSRSRNRRSHEYDEQNEVQPLARSASTARNTNRGRKVLADDEVLPAESVSIVAIEQLLPKPHICDKGEDCSKWQRQQKQLQQLRDEHGIDFTPDLHGGSSRIIIAGSPGDACKATNMTIANPHLVQPSVQECMASIPIRPTSEAVASVVASSDIFGPAQVPEFALQESTLNQLGSRDAQDNVKQFLRYQHVNSPTKPTHAQAYHAFEQPVLDLFPPHPVAPYSPDHTRIMIPPPRPSTAADSQSPLRSLPKLDIPRSASAGPQLNHLQSPNAAGNSISRHMSASPEAIPMIYRLNTPASEVDVPWMSSQISPPVAREVSNSVPPNMQFKQPKRISASHKRTSKNDWRRPSMTLAAVREGEVLDHALPSTTSSRKTSSDTQASTLVKRHTLDPAKNDPLVKDFGYGPDCSHSGWMRKRKTKMLRHDWQDAHFRLKGTQLAMHENARLSSHAKETIDTENYAVACSTIASNSKLSAAMKIFKIKNDVEASKKDKDATAFAFQLVPNAPDRKMLLSTGIGKTHHFAVNSKDQRIDWMRELMLAKALQQKGQGYEVEVNGVLA